MVPCEAARESRISCCSDVCVPRRRVSTETTAPSPRPNVVVIITDDQGYGDLGVHGNPKIKTPNIDALARESVRVKNFYVSPVCAPTRASLLTGRYNYRTGVVDTYQGRAMMHPDEVTLAEMLAACRLPDRHFRQVAPGRQLSLCGRSTRVSRRRWCSKAGGSASLGPARRQQLL